MDETILKHWGKNYKDVEISEDTVGSWKNGNLVSNCRPLIVLRCDKLKMEGWQKYFRGLMI